MRIITLPSNQRNIVTNKNEMRMKKNVMILTGAGQIGMAIARRAGPQG